jgi:hypothetical protein
MEAIAQKCLEGAESNSMTFPQVVSTLMGVGAFFTSGEAPKPTSSIFLNSLIRITTGYTYMKTSVAVLGLLLAPSLLFAESIRCGSQLILKGSTSEDLLAYCGKPTQVACNGTTHGLMGNNGVVVQIDSLGYGHDQP